MKKKLPKKKKRRVVFSASTGDGLPVESSREEKLREQQAALGVTAKAMIAGLERQDQRDWEITKKFENEPMMSGSVVWHEHRR